MKSTVFDLPSDSQSLQELVMQQRAMMAEMKETVAEKTSKIQHQKAFIDQLLEAIRLAKHQHFGARSEKFNVDQLDCLTDLLGEDLESLTDDQQSDEDDGVTVRSFKRKKGGRRSLPKNLPRIEIIHQLEGEACQCGECNTTLKAIGKKTSEQIDLIPMTVRVIRHIRTTYQCPNCKKGVHSAQLPAQPIPGSIASPGTLAHVVTDKYINGLPLYRQEAQFNRLDIPLTRSTLAQWVIKAGALVQPLINLLREELLSSSVIQMDETRQQVLKEPGKTPQSQSYMWVQRGGLPERPIILYDYDPGRSQSVPQRLLQDYRGYLQTDGYEGYNQVVRENNITQLGCWAHVRRKFDQALKAQPNNKKRQGSLAQQAMLRIQLLYKIEREAKSLSMEARCALRQKKAIPVLDGLRDWLDQHLPVVVKQSAIGKAMYYMDKQWSRLTVYTQDGQLQIDNNLCENAIRPFVIGRKNSLFSDSVQGAQASANLYGLIETAKANGIEPYRYLKRVFTLLPQAGNFDEVAQLLPWECIDD